MGNHRTAGHVSLFCGFWLFQPCDRPAVRGDVAPYYVHLWSPVGRPARRDVRELCGAQRLLKVATEGPMAASHVNSLTCAKICPGDLMIHFRPVRILLRRRLQSTSKGWRAEDCAGRERVMANGSD